MVRFDMGNTDMIRSLLASAAAAAADRKGVTAAEYAILAVAIVAAVGTAMTAFGPRIIAAFTNLLPAAPGV
jgi:Flp pilus assembly pilin Flp